MGQIQSTTSRGSFATEMTFEGAASASLQDDIFEAATSGHVEVLASLLDANEFDLTTLDGSTRETLLHRALSSGQDDVVTMLLERAGDDPLIIDATDKDGYTPLMRATERCNVPMMQALVEHGARSDGNVDVLGMARDVDALLELSSAHRQAGPGGNDSYMDLLFSVAKRHYVKKLSNSLQGTVDTQAHATTAQLLVEARGDLSKAYELAAERRFGYAANFYLDAQMNTVPPMRTLKGERLRCHDALAALGWAQQTESEGLVALLVSYHIVSSVLQNGMQGCSDAAKIAVLKRFVAAAGAASPRLTNAAALYCRQNEQGHAWTENACRSFHFDHLRLLIAAGVRCDPLLIDIFKSAPPVVLQKIGAMAIDCHTMMTLVRERIGGADVSQKIRALLPGVINSLLETNELSGQERILALRELPLEDVRPVVTQVMLASVRNGKSLEHARLLIEAGASTIDVLGELAKANDRVALLTFIRMGANFFPAMAQLFNRDEQEAANLLGVAAALVHAPAGPGNPGKPKLQS